MALPGSFSIGLARKEHLVGQVHRVGVGEIDLQLRRAGLVDQRVDVQLHRVAVVVHQVEDRVELVDRIDRIGLARRFRTARAARRGQQREIRVGVLLHQEELQFRCHDGAQAQFGIGVQHPAQHVARGQLVRFAGLGVAVVDDLRRRVGGPGHHAHGVRVRTQDHVRIRRRGQVVVIVGELARDRSGEDAFRQARAVIVRELVGGDDLAARVAGDVRHQAFDLGDPPLLQPAQQAAFLRCGGRGRLARARSGTHRESSRFCWCCRQAWPNARKIA
ncbi:hypothetical protein G6F65_017589 [Rhizopus arrhizus]|nr:hypothetical protein G6F65_017589 [Rhizopus arrhizus]